MRQEILDLIQHHKTAKEEVYGLLNELTQISQQKISKEDKNSLKETILKYEEEYAWRGIFISQLEGLL